MDWLLFRHGLVLKLEMALGATGDISSVPILWTIFLLYMNRLVPNVNELIKALSWAPVKVKFRLLIREGFVIGIFVNSNLAKHFQNNNFFNKTKPVINPLCK